MKDLLFKTINRTILAAAILSASMLTHAQPKSPGPYEILPFDDAYIVEAFTDLLAGSQRADWTGWSGSTWISPNCYDGHNGIDFSMGTGTPVYAATTGTVVEIERNRPENDHNSSYSYGNYVKIHADGVSPKGQQLTVLTAHLRDVLPGIQIGTLVGAGELIGHSDNTGNSTSEHCHVESSFLDGATYIKTCGLYNAHYKYPIMLNPTGTKQVGHVLKVKILDAPIRSDMFNNSSVITTAHQDQLYFASFAKRGYYRVFIPNNSTIRSGWIKAQDVEEVVEGTVIQPLPDAGTYVHATPLASVYSIRDTPASDGTPMGQIYFAGGHFVSDQQAPGDWYRIPIPGGGSASWGWVQADDKMVVYPQLHNPQIDLPAILAAQKFPYSSSFDTVGIASFGRPKFDRNSVKDSSPDSHGNALFITDSINSGNGAYDTVSVGRPEDSDYYVQADVYFNHNPAYGTYERYGIFLRDDSFGGFDQTFEGAGNCYAMTWDSDDGRLRCCKIVDATITDFPATQIYMPTTGWHTMRIEALGTTIRYYLDGNLKDTTTDATFISGLAGMGYSSHLSGYPAARGAYFDNFIADKLPAAAVSDWSVY